MSRLLQIASREYLSYVRTVGFWLSLVVTPLALTASISVPFMMDHTAPPVRMAVIDLTHQGIGRELIARLQDPSNGPHRPQIVRAPAEALAAPDAQTADAVLRRLMGGAAAQDRNARTFDAAAVLSGKGEAVSLDLWSLNLADGQFERLVRANLAEALHRQSLIDAGVSPKLLDTAEAAQPQVALYSPKSEEKGQVSLRDTLPSVLGFGMGILLWAVILTGAGLLLNSVIEEKSSRILEVLLTSASVPEVMGGKILGVMGVAATVLGFWLSLAAMAARIAAPGLLGQIAAVVIGKGLIVYFGLYLVVGYIMYASIFAAVGAFCETSRDAQTLLGPIMLTLSVPLIFMAQAISHPDAPVLTVLSWIPPFTPFLMAARVANNPPAYQVVGTLVLMVATTAVVVWISGRAFRAGALTVGKVERRAVLAAFMGKAG